MPAAIIYKSIDSTLMELPERIAKLEVQVEAIKDDVSELKSDVKEIHSRITTGNREIVDKLEAMENRLEDQMKRNSETSGRQHNEMQMEFKKDIDSVKSRVVILESWRWMIVGGGIAIGYLVSHLELFSRIIPK
jgi:predicted  nucleic acid-binding Zn-ribbon protein